MQENAWLLPEHKLRQKQSELEQLQQRLDAAVADARPRKKFSFSSKPRGVSAAPAAASTTMQELAQREEAAAEARSSAAVPSLAAPKVPNADAAPLSTDWCASSICACSCTSSWLAHFPRKMLGTRESSKSLPP